MAPTSDFEEWYDDESLEKEACDRLMPLPPAPRTARRPTTTARRWLAPQKPAMTVSENWQGAVAPMGTLL